jgi:hypothetical protein
MLSYNEVQGCITFLDRGAAPHVPTSFPSRKHKQKGKARRGCCSLVSSLHANFLTPSRRSVARERGLPPARGATDCNFRPFRAWNEPCYWQRMFGRSAFRYAPRQVPPLPALWRAGRSFTPSSGAVCAPKPPEGADEGLVETPHAPALTPRPRLRTYGGDSYAPRTNEGDSSVTLDGASGDQSYSAHEDTVTPGAPSQ